MTMLMATRGGIDVTSKALMDNFLNYPFSNDIAHITVVLIVSIPGILSAVTAFWAMLNARKASATSERVASATQRIETTVTAVETQTNSHLHELDGKLSTSLAKLRKTEEALQTIREELNAYQAMGKPLASPLDQEGHR